MSIGCNLPEMNGSRDIKIVDGNNILTGESKVLIKNKKR